MQTKKELRAQLLASRNALSKDMREALTQSITRHVLTHPDYLKAKRLLIYKSFRSEVGTHDIITDALQKDKEVFLPVVDLTTDHLVLVRYDGLKTPLKRSSFGVEEPIATENNCIHVEKIDLILAPGAAFDSRGYRIGYGGGYYDKLLSTPHRHQIKAYALCFTSQIIERVPQDDYDQVLDGWFSETGFHSVKA
jgi:5-formyltetrahydrofolate cyclo-ligase